MKNVLAIDFGASSGRAVIGSFDGERIKLTEIHRFSNDPVTLGGTMYWDFLRLFHEIKQALVKAKEYGEIDSIAIDTWGVDFGLIDKDGRLLEQAREVASKVLDADPALEQPRNAVLVRELRKDKYNIKDYSKIS